MPPLTTTFAALGDPVRFAIAERLLKQGAMPAGKLRDVADISAPAISRHLRVMRKAGIVTQEVNGPRRIYAIDPSAVARIDAWLKLHRDFWAAGLDRLAQVQTLDKDQDGRS